MVRSCCKQILPALSEPVLTLPTLHTVYGALDCGLLSSIVGRCLLWSLSLFLAFDLVSFIFASPAVVPQSAAALTGKACCLVALCSAGVL